MELVKYKRACHNSGYQYTQDMIGIVLIESGESETGPAGRHSDSVSGLLRASPKVFPRIVYKPIQQGMPIEIRFYPAEYAPRHCGKALSESGAALTVVKVRACVRRPMGRGWSQEPPRISVGCFLLSGV